MALVVALTCLFTTMSVAEGAEATPADLVDPDVAPIGRSAGLDGDFHSGPLGAAGGHEPRVAAQVGQLTAINAPCLDAVFIGARGSGQDADDADGLGPQVGYARDLYMAAVSGHRVAYWPVNYPAHDTKLLFIARIHQYFEGLDQGVKDIKALLRARSRTCPQEHYVLAGYSQGAMVVHRALWEIADGEVPLPMRRIDGVIQIADGDRQIGQGGHRLGTAPNSIGISLINTSVSHARYRAQRRDVPSGVARRFFSICDLGDIVCDPVTAGVSLAGGGWFAATQVFRGTKIHTGHYLPGNAGVKAVETAAFATAEVTQARPPVPPLDIISALPPGLAGRPYSGQLSATGGAPPYTFWSNRLPTGFVLTPDGQLTGTFTSPPPVTFKVRVADANGQLLWESVTINNEDYVVADCGYWGNLEDPLVITAGGWVAWGNDHGSGPIVDSALSSYQGTIYYGDGASEPIWLGGGPYRHTYPTPGTYNARIVADGVLAANSHQCHDDRNAPVIVNPAAPTPAVSLVRGGSAPAGFWYSASLSGFTPGSQVTVTCHDSVDPGGFWNQTFTIAGDGTAADSTLCYSGDGPDHWVTGGGVESNHVGW